MPKVILLLTALLLLASCSNTDPNPTCGNGLVEGQEQCDGGLSCGGDCRWIVGNPSDPAR